MQSRSPHEFDRSMSVAVCSIQLSDCLLSVIKIYGVTLAINWITSYHADCFTTHARQLCVESTRWHG